MNKKDFRENRSHENLERSDYNIKLNQYVNSLYKGMTDLASIHIKKTCNKKILKTDLRDAVIEKERNMLFYLSKKFENDFIYWIDISNHLVEQVKKNYPNVITKQVDLTKWDLSFMNFDFLGDYSTLDHIEDKNLWKVFAFYHQVLNEDGIGLVIYYRRSPRIKFANWLYKIFSKQSFFEKWEKIWQYFFDDHLVKKNIKNNSMRIIEEYNINILSSFPFFVWKFIPQKIINWLKNKESKWKLKLFTSLFSSMRAVIIKKTSCN